MANFRAGCSNCWKTSSFVTNAVLVERKSCELLTSAPADLADYTIFGYLALKFTPKWTKNAIVGSQGGVRAPVPHSWRRHCLRRTLPSGQRRFQKKVTWAAQLTNWPGVLHIYRGRPYAKFDSTHTLEFHPPAKRAIQCRIDLLNLLSLTGAWLK